MRTKFMHGGHSPGWHFLLQLCVHPSGLGFKHGPSHCKHSVAILSLELPSLTRWHSSSQTWLPHSKIIPHFRLQEYGLTSEQGKLFISCFPKHSLSVGTWQGGHGNAMNSTSDGFRSDDNIGCVKKESIIIQVIPLLAYILRS